MKSLIIIMIRSACRLVGAGLVLLGLFFVLDMFIPKSKPIGVYGVLIELLLGVLLVILGVVFRRFGETVLGKSGS